MFTPIREGNRGGRGLFSWEDVRVMSYRDRECYLGSTVSLGFLDKGGRWRKKDWWVKTDKETEALDKEKIKNQDLDNIKQALGIVEKPKKTKKISEHEQAELLRKREDGEKKDVYSAGLGYIAPADEKLKTEEKNSHNSSKPRKKRKRSSYNEY